MSNVHNVTLDGKVTKEVICAGSGPQPICGQKVAVHYVGTLTNGEQIDSSRERGKEFCFTIGRGVIPGWSIGVATMKVGETSKFTIGPEYAFGSKEFTGLFAAESTLVFEIELLRIF
jgi:FKBP-type peptidyl-prolyl cis-trans isomerase